ncbi:MAG: hypothetical protein KDA60_14110, partial [Planctomycetales bacterium]|nr:hypothetical protein [Planctomycetales bacterium]
DGNLSIIPAGTPIGAWGEFTAMSFSLPDSSDGFLGMRTTSDDGYHYGWVRVSTDFDGGMVVQDAALEREPNRAIVAGVVPEPSSFWTGTAAVAALMVMFGRYRARLSAT